MVKSISSNPGANISSRSSSTRWRLATLSSNLSEELHGIRYLSKGSSWGDKLKSVAQALRFFFTQTSWDQTGQLLGPDGVAVWDLQAEAAKHDTDAKRWTFLVISLKERSELRVALSNLTPPDAVPRAMIIRR